MLFTNINKLNHIFIFVFLALLTLSACQTEYTTQHFSFPPGSKPHEDNWEYTALIIVSSRKRPITKRSKKNIQIKVYNKSKAIFLDDNFEFISASIEANIVWEKFEEIRVGLIEVGNKYADDQYNKQLLKSGPKSLLELTYKYEHETKKFKRVKGEKSIDTEEVPALVHTEQGRKKFRQNWARLIQKIYEVDPLICPKCNEEMRIIAFIEHPLIIKKILKQLGIWVTHNHVPPQ
jgi:hypothetical protein